MALKSIKSRRQSNQSGYALVALLALMTVLAISMMAVAPSARQQTRRELEREAIARGEEVAEAIRKYITINPSRQPPTSMDELLEGVAPPGRPTKIQVLRASAARDPLTKDGTWRLIRPNDDELKKFVAAITRYANKQVPRTNDPALASSPLFRAMPGTSGPILDLEDDAFDDAPCDEDASDSGSGPFIGVASRSRCASVITYYGIARHDKWIFTPFYR
jgi:type II secretory pathway pseudopilin PulG